MGMGTKKWKAGLRLCSIWQAMGVTPLPAEPGVHNTAASETCYVYTIQRLLSPAEILKHQNTNVDDPVIMGPETVDKGTFAGPAATAVLAQQGKGEVDPVIPPKEEAVGVEFDIETVFPEDRLDVDVEAVGDDLEIDPPPPAET